MTATTKSKNFAEQVTKLAGATGLTMFADRLSLLIMLSFFVLAGPGGEDVGIGSLELLAPTVVFAFGCGVFADMVGGRSAMFMSNLVRAITLFCLPWLMVSTGANRYVLAATIALCVVASTQFSVGKFAFVANVVNSRDLLKANSTLHFFCALATLAAVFGLIFAGPEIQPDTVIKFGAVMALVAALVTLSIAVPNKTSPLTTRTKSKGAVGALFSYLTRHGKTRELFRLLVLLSFVFVFWNMLLLYLILENYQPGGADLHWHFCFAFAGSAIGALLAPRANRIARPLTILCATVTGVFLASLICLSATTLTTVKYALGIAGVNCGLALAVIDTILQRITPNRFRGAVSGCRDAIVAILVLLTVVGVEAKLEKVALVNIFRVLGLIHILAGAWLFLLWSRYARFTFRLFAWPIMAAPRKLQTDSPHHFRSTRCAAFACAEVPWEDIAVVSGNFTAPTVFVVISNRTRKLDRFFWSMLGGTIAPDQNAAVERLATMLSRGYNVIMIGDELADSKNSLCKRVVAHCLTQSKALIPCSIRRTVRNSKKLSFSCGAAFTDSRKASPAKLSSELEFLSAKKEKEEPHVS